MPDREPHDGDPSILGDENLVDTTSIVVVGPFTEHVEIIVPPLRTSDDDLDGVVDDDEAWVSDAPASSTNPRSNDDDDPAAVAGDDADAVEVAVVAELDAADDDAVVTGSGSLVEAEDRGTPVTAEIAANVAPEAPRGPEPDPEPAAVPSGDGAGVALSAATPGRRAERRARTGEIDLQSRRLGDLAHSGETADLLTADRLLDPAKRVATEPEGLWRHLIYTLSGRRITLGDSKRSRARKELDRRISAPLPGGARFVPVLSRKGGVGKTTITTLLGMALADAREDRVIAIDANPDRGTLADRIEATTGSTVRDLIRRRDRIAGFNDISGLVARDHTRLDVLASDADPHVSEAFSDDDYAEVARVAAHYYSVVLTDTGTGIVHSVMAATLDFANQLVVVAGLTVDEARLASETLTWLEANGYEDQVRSAVVVINAGRPGAPLVRASELESHFRTRVRTVVSVPYDPHIAGGSAVRFGDLQPETRLAARTLAAAVVEGLRREGVTS